MSKIIKGDTVMVISGKDKGKVGNVLQVVRKGFDKSAYRVVVSGVNICTKHQKSKVGSSGSIQKVERPLCISNIALFCKSTNGPSKVYYGISNDEKVRMYRKTNEVVG